MAAARESDLKRRHPLRAPGGRRPLQVSRLCPACRSIYHAAVGCKAVVWNTPTRKALWIHPALRSIAGESAYGWLPPLWLSPIRFFPPRQAPQPTVVSLISFL